MAMNLKGRLEKLEAAAPMKGGNFCQVVHHEDCKRDRVAAIAEYVEKYGHEPENFINVLIISPETKQSICGCKSELVTEAA